MTAVLVIVIARSRALAFEGDGDDANPVFLAGNEDWIASLRFAGNDGSPAVVIARSRALVCEGDGDEAIQFFPCQKPRLDCSLRSQ